MYVEQESVVLYSAGNVKLANVVGIKLVQKCADIEFMIVGVAFEVVDIDDQATTGSTGEHVEETGIGVVGRRIGEDVNNVLREERESVSLLNTFGLFANHVERLFGLRYREHDTQMLAIDFGVAEMLAMPGDVELFEEIV